MEAPRVEDAGGTRGAATNHSQGCPGPWGRLGPCDAPGDRRVRWGLWLRLSGPPHPLPAQPGPGSRPGPHLTPSAAEARSWRPRTHMVMATFTSCTSSSRRREPKKLSSANLAAE